MIDTGVEKTTEQTPADAIPAIFVNRAYLGIDKTGGWRIGFTEIIGNVEIPRLAVAMTEELALGIWRMIDAGFKERAAHNATASQEKDTDGKPFN